MAIIFVSSFFPISLEASAEEVAADDQESRKQLDTDSDINPKHHKNAEKIISFLKVAGVYNDSIKSAAYFIDERSDDGYFKFHETNISGINMQFRYDMGSIHRENFELNFKPDNSDVELNANSEHVMLRYNLEF